MILNTIKYVVIVNRGDIVVSGAAMCRAELCPVDVSWVRIPVISLNIILAFFVSKYLFIYFYTLSHNYSTLIFHGKLYPRIMGNLKFTLVFVICVMDCLIWILACIPLSDNMAELSYTMN